MVRGGSRWIQQLENSVPPSWMVDTQVHVQSCVALPRAPAGSWGGGCAGAKSSWHLSLRCWCCWIAALPALLQCQTYKFSLQLNQMRFIFGYYCSRFKNVCFLKFFMPQFLFCGGLYFDTSYSYFQVQQLHLEPGMKLHFKYVFYLCKNVILSLFIRYLSPVSATVLCCICLC